MLVPLSWLRDFAPFDLSPAELAATFDDLGMVVEGIQPVGEGLDGVVVARVADIQAIEGADKIRRVLVDAGGPDPVQVVCGAWNFEVGDSVPLARVGAVLPGDFEITRRKMRGVVSDGMLCSPVELRLGTDAGGLLVLPPGLEPGAPIADALGVEADVVFDLAIETNRPDAMSIAGVARDAAARLKLPFAIPDAPAVEVPGDPSLVEVAAPDICPRFSATVFEGAQVGPSPQWVARRLTLAGMRPISNLVDASNYVMLELGQPTHPYDLDKLPGRGLRVRAANPGETVETLDGVERRLGDGPNPDCLICDAEDRPVGIAGVMGGASSEISDTTSTVLLEAAYFDRMAIARTSKRIALRSEASARFERGCDPNGIERAVARFAELAGLRAVREAVVGAPAEPLVVRVRTDRVNAVLGTELDDEQIRGYLGPIGFEARPAGAGAHDVAVPTFRPDTEQEIDVVEEVARHHGYSNIRRTVPSTPLAGHMSTYQRERRLVRQVMAGAGVSEATTGVLIGPDDHQRAGIVVEHPIEADSPLAKEESVLRASLRPGLLTAVAFNAARQNPDVALFEIGEIFLSPKAGDVLPDEHERLGAVLSGTGIDAAAAVELWRVLADALRIDGIELRAGEVDGLHPTRTAHLLLGDVRVGELGEIDPQVVAEYGLDGRVAYLGVDLGILLRDAPRRSERMREVSRFPASDVDLAFLVDDGVPAAAVEGTLLGAAGELLEDLRLFDVYRSEQLGEGRRSLAYRLRFRAPDRTLTDGEVADIRQRCIDAVASAHGGELRS